MPFIPAACRLTAASVHQAWHTFMIQGTKPALAMCLLLQRQAQLLKKQGTLENGDAAANPQLIAIMVQTQSPMTDTRVITYFCEVTDY